MFEFAPLLAMILVKLVFQLLEERQRQRNQIIDEIWRGTVARQGHRPTLRIMTSSSNWPELGNRPHFIVDDDPSCWDDSRRHDDGSGIHRNESINIRPTAALPILGGDCVISVGNYPHGIGWESAFHPVSNALSDSTFDTTSTSRLDTLGSDFNSGNDIGIGSTFD